MSAFRRVAVRAIDVDETPDGFGNPMERYYARARTRGILLATRTIRRDFNGHGAIVG